MRVIPPHRSPRFAAMMPPDNSASPTAPDSQSGESPWDATAAPSRSIPWSGGTILGAGNLLGNRYRLIERLGQGSRGEVWRARDLELEIDIALKSVSPCSGPADGHDRLRQEVAAARAVASPHVCRVLDLVEVQGRELIAMELVDGQPLPAYLRARAPLALAEANAIAQQMLQGLAAIHRAGLVHRDLQPSQIMVADGGRVVIMDFVLAAVLAGQCPNGAAAGARRYVSPEQARGEQLDARSDLYAAAMVCDELLAAGRTDFTSAASGPLQASPAAPHLPESPWRPALLRALDPTPSARPQSAQALACDLHELTARASSTAGTAPFPGMRPFTAAEADRYYGRDAEIERIWKRIPYRQLIALVGPSGAGKTSFVHAGIAAHAPERWRVLALAPRSDPFAALGAAVSSAAPAHGSAAGPESSGHPLVWATPAAARASFERWRLLQDSVLLVLDPGEELFSQTPRELRAAFIELLSFSLTELGVHVILSIRDDYFFRCQEYPALAPVFDNLFPLAPPTAGALFRAFSEPVEKLGFRYESRDLVAEMIAAGTGEAAALPLLSFAAARLWEEREQTSRTLTIAAYRRIGGVAGALARHADAVVASLGPERLALVREIFRNLMTLEGKPISRRVRELAALSPDAGEVDAVLATLADARLLTRIDDNAAVASAPPASGLAEEPAPARNQRVEVIHESLLQAWPRLVRWRAQDVDCAVFRDELRQAAVAWEDSGRKADRLWTGEVYREYELWRSRYPVQLTEIEAAFADAMDRCERRRAFRRRIGLSAVIAGLLRPWG
ncbi:MAG: protein kinase [Candidatus Schekmanbacteria bacterium]|nr:protein kinase [Candidatus Schekmanbacteria bacterium]